MTLESVPAELQSLREQIDRLDHALVLLLANRFALTGRVGQLKAEAGLQACDPAREQDKLDVVRALCQEHGLDESLMAEILELVMREVVKNHERIRGAHTR